MTKKRTETPLPCIIKNGKWFNTITQRYVSESYAKRINSYFLKYPRRTVVQARGHGVYIKYEKENVKTKLKPLSEQSKETRKMLYGRGTQLIRTKTRKGKTVYYSPIEKQFVEDESFIKSLKKLDYTKMNGNMVVALYRMTRDRQNIYHTLSVDVQQRLTTGAMVDFWTPDAWYIFESLWKESKKIWKKHELGAMTCIYFTVSCYFYSDVDGWEKGTSSRVYAIHGAEFKKLMKEDFKSRVLDWYYNKLEIDAYHNIMVQKINFYIMGKTSQTTDIQKQVAHLRLGVTKIR